MYSNNPDVKVNGTIVNLLIGLEACQMMLIISLLFTLRSSPYATQAEVTTGCGIIVERLADIETRLAEVQAALDKHLALQSKDL